MELQIKEDFDWDIWERAEIIELLKKPGNNGGTEVPEGVNLAQVFQNLPSASVGVWLNGEAALCLSILPIDHSLRTGLFHVAGTRKLPFNVAAKIARGWLRRYAEEGYSIRAFTASAAVMRWGRMIGFEVWGQDGGTGDWVGEYVNSA